MRRLSYKCVRKVVFVLAYRNYLENSVFNHPESSQSIAHAVVPELLLCSLGCHLNIYGKDHDRRPCHSSIHRRCSLYPNF